MNTTRLPRGLLALGPPVISADLSSRRLVKTGTHHAIPECFRAEATLASGTVISLVVETDADSRQPRVSEARLTSVGESGLDAREMRSIASQWPALTEAVVAQAMWREDGEGWTWEGEPEAGPRLVRQRVPVTDSRLRSVADSYANGLTEALGSGASGHRAKGAAMARVLASGYSRSQAFKLVKLARERGFLPKDGGL